MKGLIVEISERFWTFQFTGSLFWVLFCRPINPLGFLVNNVAWELRVSWDMEELNCGVPLRKALWKTLRQAKDEIIGDVITSLSNPSTSIYFFQFWDLRISSPNYIFYIYFFQHFAIFLRNWWAHAQREDRRVYE